MSSSLPSDENEPVRDWSFPEFGLPTHANHTITKRLKVKNNVDEKQLQRQNELAYQEAVRKGFEAGMQQATQEMNKKMQTVSVALTELVEYKRRFLEQIKRDCLMFVPMICEKILLEQIALKPDIMLNIVSKAIDLIDNNVSQLKISGAKNIAPFFDQIDLKAKAKQIIIEIDESKENFCFAVESDKQILEFNLWDALNKLISESVSPLIGTQAE
ncbi:MAG: hypothetical protein BGO43_11125 [Gammaproteobacteria bacterium 39-13]|nr:hypothetical protein [Gammaproteobacteria bacterium]OJV86589.1 MAG: hypothetical protein BGO43_11125 [Gammaproteobacteria bacterium 39-13]